MDAHERIALVRHMVESFSRRDFDEALSAAAEDFTWEPFLARTETPLLRGRAEVKAAWESQVEALDLRVEPLEFIPVGEDRLVVPARLCARGKGSDMALDASVTFVATFGENGLVRSIVTHRTREEAFEAVGPPE